MRPWLPATEARCRPGGSRRDTCGRALAALPERGGRVVDFAQMVGCDACPHYLPASECRPPEGAPRRVFPPLGG